ncbi:MAG: hypothetical protein FWE32_04835 [Oscillospiraceae bacterium]|nr:hypothetical protein [Oscillospiraceae bacterium]
MRAKKWLVIITFIVAILSLSGVFLCFFTFKYFYEIWYDILLAVFGSATLGFIMSLIEYFAERRRSMEAFYVEALDAARVFGKAICLFPDEPIELIKNCIHEEDNNERFRKASKNLPIEKLGLLGMEIKDEERKAFTSFLCTKMGVSLEDIELNQLNELYNEKFIQYREKIHKCLDGYLTILDSSLRIFDDAIGSLDFIFANRTIRKAAYKNIYIRLREARYDLLDKARFFRMAKDEEGHLPICLTLIQELNCALFKIEEITKGDYHTIVVYQKFYDELCNDIERFRAKIYGHTPDIRESKPFREYGALIHNKAKDADCL